MAVHYVNFPAAVNRRCVLAIKPLAGGWELNDGRGLTIRALTAREAFDSWASREGMSPETKGCTSGDFNHSIPGAFRIEYAPGGTVSVAQVQEFFDEIAARSVSPPVACSDCKGSGQYVGLLETSACTTCGGTGQVAVPA